MRVVVVGATGNVGMSVVRAVRDDKSVDHVIGLARRHPTGDTLGIEWRRVDIVADDLIDHFRGADAVIHLAWVQQPTRRRALLHNVNVVGSARIFEAVAAAGVGALLYASSASAYSPAPVGSIVDERWPIEGITTSIYSRQKMQVERILDEFEDRHPFVRVVRLRPALTLKAAAAAAVRRLFLGVLLSAAIAPASRFRAVPDVAGLVLQIVHTEDVAEAYRLALLGSITGAYNIAAEPALDGKTIAKHFGLHPLPMSAGLARASLALGWKLHLQPLEPGWFDLASRSPLLAVERAHDELGWVPTQSGFDVLLEMAESVDALTRSRSRVQPL
ncbi:MAG: NAD-dependent epimerase/dehydratase family protein [Acidimicrobiales bacterium]